MTGQVAYSFCFGCESEHIKFLLAGVPARLGAKPQKLLLVRYEPKNEHWYVDFQRKWGIDILRYLVSRLRLYGDVAADKSIHGSVQSLLNQE